MTGGYPTLEQVAVADLRQLTAWVRYLPSPTVQQRHIIDAMIARREQLKSADPAAAVAASKAVGWDR